MTYVLDKALLVDKIGRPLTQGLFLEIGYNTEYAVFTLGENDKDYNGKIYPSLKKLYLAEEDPTEYQFAKKYMLSWKHWKRLNENVVLREYFDEWRDELEIALRSSAIRSIMDESMENFQAAKWLADKGWGKKEVGRPSKDNRERDKSIRERISKEIEADVERMSNLDG